MLAALERSVAADVRSAAGAILAILVAVRVSSSAVLDARELQVLCLASLAEPPSHPMPIQTAPGQLSSSLDATEAQQRWPLTSWLC